MTKCWGQQKKRRYKRHGDSYASGNPHKTKPFRGHKWVGHGAERVCELCGRSPPGRGK